MPTALAEKAQSGLGDGCAYALVPQPGFSSRPSFRALSEQESHLPQFERLPIVCAEIVSNGLCLQYHCECSKYYRSGRQNIR